MKIFEMMNNKPASNSEVYLYEENGKWFAHEQSAALLRKLCKNITLPKKTDHPLLSTIQRKIEVDLNELLAMKWFIALCSDEEILLIKTD